MIFWSIILVKSSYDYNHVICFQRKGLKVIKYVVLKRMGLEDMNDAHPTCQFTLSSSYSQTLYLYSASVNEILLCGLGGQKLYNGENADHFITLVRIRTFTEALPLGAVHILRQPKTGVPKPPLPPPSAMVSNGQLGV